jgi:hypothetical protein
MSTQYHRDELPIRTLASGHQLTIPIHVFEGDTSGPKVYIQANIHGPEIAGIGALHELIKRLHKQSVNGTLVIVPNANPVGLNSKVNGMQTGYADLNETVVGNFNRIYQMPVVDTAPEDPDPDEPRKVAVDQFAEQHKDDDLPALIRAYRTAIGEALDEMWATWGQTGMRHGQKLALTLQRLSYDADYLIDLHTAGNAIYHMYTFESCLPSVRYFDLPYTVQLDESFSGVLDEAFLQPWTKLHAALAEAGRELAFADFQKEAFTPELGSADTLLRDNMTRDAERLINYLRYRGVLDGDPQQPNGEFIYCTQGDYLRYQSPSGGVLLWHKQPGDRVEAGETLVTILRPYEIGHGETETPVTATRDGVVINISGSQVTHEGMSLCSVITKPKSLPMQSV